MGWLLEDDTVLTWFLEVLEKVPSLESLEIWLAQGHPSEPRRLRTCLSLFQKGLSAVSLNAFCTCLITSLHSTPMKTKPTHFVAFTSACHLT
jgi:hypothetical protein